MHRCALKAPTGPDEWLASSIDTTQESEKTRKKAYGGLLLSAAERGKNLKNHFVSFDSIDPDSRIKNLQEFLKAISQAASMGSRS